MDEMEKFEKLFEKEKVFCCSQCQGDLLYDGSGMYHCSRCGHQELDDFGKIRKFLDEHGSASILDVQRATGVSKKSIEKLLKDGRIEFKKNTGIL